jgi:hypothetical protein
MVTVAEPQSRQGEGRLAPVTALIGAAPAVVCEALLQYAEHHEGVLLWNGSTARDCPGRWIANIDIDSLTVAFSLQNGPLPHLVIRFSTEPADGEYTSLTAATDYALAGARMDGIWERWKARRAATGMRDGLLVGLKQVLQVAHLAADRRRAVRFPLHTMAQLRAGEQTWHGEVVNVSATGLGMILATPEEEVDDAAMILCAHGAGEVALIFREGHVRAKVLITRAIPHRKGIEVGLWMCDSAEASRLAQTVQPYITQGA